MDNIQIAKIIELPKLREFINAITTNISLTDEYISSCSKGIFEFIKESKSLKDVYPSMKLIIKKIDRVEVKSWLEIDSKRLSIKELVELGNLY